MLVLKIIERLFKNVNAERQLVLYSLVISVFTLFISLEL